MTSNVSCDIKISILTPSWNRAEYLPKVWQGIVQQEGVGIEWIVGDDGSEDTTIKVVESLARKSKFPVTLISASIRIGKSCIDNVLVKEARGEFVIWCDSDDVLNKGALRKLLDSWSEIHDQDKINYMGVSARAETKDGVLGNKLTFPVDGRSWNDIYAAIGSDLVIMARRGLLIENPFREVDFLIPETSVWNIIGEKYSKFIDCPLKTVNYNQPFALSYTNRMQYSRGRAYALGGNYRFVSQSLGLKGKVIRAINFIRYCVHGDIQFTIAYRIWTGGIFSHCLLIPALLPAIMLVIRDRVRGVVDKTHIEFEANRKSAVLSYQSWNLKCDK